MFFHSRILLWVLIGLSILILTILVCNAIVRMPAIIADLERYHDQRRTANQERRLAKEEERKKHAAHKLFLKEQKEKEEELEREVERELQARKVELERELKEKLATLRKSKERKAAPVPSPVASALEVAPVASAPGASALEVASVAPDWEGPRFYVREDSKPLPPNFRLEISSALARRRAERSLVTMNKEQ